MDRFPLGQLTLGELENFQQSRQKVMKSVQQPWERRGKDRVESNRNIIDRTWSLSGCGR